MKTLAAALGAGRWIGWDLAHRVASTRWIRHHIVGANYRTLIPIEKVSLQQPRYQAPAQHAAAGSGSPGRYLKGIERWGLEYQTYDAGLLELPDGRFELPQCAVGVRGRYVEDAYIFSNFPPPWAAHRYGMLFHARARKLPAGTFLPMLGYKNYYHWLIDILPRLQMLEDTVWKERPVYVHKHLPRYARESLDLLPYRFEYLVDGYYCADYLCVPTRLSQIEFTPPASLRWLRETFLHGDPVRTQMGRKLFISRKDAGSRALIGEDAIYERLEPLGFERVTAANMSFLDQVRLFSQAEIVTGSHGAGFTNIIWMPRGSALVEITSDAHVGHSFWRICNQLGHYHGFIEGHADDSGITVDVDQYFTLIKRALDDLEIAPALLPRVAQA